MKKATLTIDSYKVGDTPYVLVNDIKPSDKSTISGYVRMLTFDQNKNTIWTSGKVVSKYMITPKHGARHKPYPMFIVEHKRTYWKGDSNGNGYFYEAITTSGFCLREEIGLMENTTNFTI